MKRTNLTQWTIKDSADTNLLLWIDAFLIDRKAQGLAKGTIYFYQKKLELFIKFCEGQLITSIDQITPSTIREYLLFLENTGHNAGGCHACYRTLRTFLYWWEAELEPEGWKNPIKKTKAPKLVNTPLQPVTFTDIQKMIDTCDNSFMGKRDLALLLCLYDTGVRASELLEMDIDDLDRIYGSIFIPYGKGKKSRTVFLGKKSRKAIRAYLKLHNGNSPALWQTIQGERLTYWGLRQIIQRRAKQAGINAPGIHDFRRAFALQCLRNGMDVYSLQKLMGHADLQILRRYLAQTNDDLQKSHAVYSPVDHSKI